MIRVKSNCRATRLYQTDMLLTTKLLSSNIFFPTIPYFHLLPSKTHYYVICTFSVKICSSKYEQATKAWNCVLCNTL
jgi:hypothetical protein